MPKFNDIELPHVTVTPGDIDALKKALAAEPMSPEAMVEIAIYLKREMAKAEALNVAVKLLAGRLKGFMDDLPAEKRETRRTKVGMCTYTDVGEKVELVDRDNSVQMMTDEQLRITYKPDIKAMETIMKKDEFERHVKRTPTDSKITIRETSGNTDYDELDF